MTRKTLFSFIVITFFALSLLFLSTCKKDPTSPGENESQTTATIGPDGGKLETAEFSLQVPAGSFQNETDLSLSISTEESSFGESSVSQSFIIKGLPDEFDKSIRLAIKYNGELSDSSFIAIGKMSYDYFSADSSVVYHFISIKDSSGFLVGSLYGNPDNSANKMANRTDDIVNPWTWFIGATGQKEYKTDHFNFKYPSILGSVTIQTLANNFEEALSKLIGEFNFKFPDWWWQLDVIINDNTSAHTWGKDEKGYAIINVAESLLPQSQSVKNQINISKVLMSLAMFNNSDEAKGAGVIGHWIGLTVFTYISNYINITEPHYPTELGGNELIPFGGLNTDSSREADEILKRHGGMQSWIKYMVQTEKIAKTKIVDYICLYSICSDNELLTNFINAVSEFIADWWPDYFEQLIKGEIYNIDDSVFLNTENLGGTFDIDSDEKTETFLSGYSDLSAKRFIVNLKNSGIDESANLFLDATGNSGYDGVATLVFGVNSSNNLEHLVTAKNSATGLPKKLKEYYDNGTRKFLVVVVNSTHNAINYLGSTNIELKIEVKKEEIVDYNYCSVSIKTVYDIHRERVRDGSSVDYTDELGILQGFWGTIENGEFSSSSPSQNSGTDFVYEGSLKVNLNNDMDLLNSFSMTSLITKPNIPLISACVGSNVHVIEKFEIKGGNVPFLERKVLPNGTPTLKFSFEGANTCGHITLNTYESTQECTNPYSGTWDDTVVDVSTGYSCNAQSKIVVTFSKY